MRLPPTSFGPIDTDAVVRRGSYIVPFAKVKQTTAYGNNEKLAKDLWELSEAIVTEKIGGI